MPRRYTPDAFAHFALSRRAIQILRFLRHGDDFALDLMTRFDDMYIIEEMPTVSSGDGKVDKMSQQDDTAACMFHFILRELEASPDTSIFLDAHDFKVTSRHTRFMTLIASASLGFTEAFRRH